MITLYSGTPGSGKSLHLAQLIINRCRFEKITIGNFEINRNKVKNHQFYEYVENVDIVPEKLIERSYQHFDVEGNKFKEGDLLLIIDEAQLLFNVREWNIVGRSDWISFFTQHRKYGYDIVLVAQFDKMLDKQLRSLLEYEVVHRKMSNFGWKGKMISCWTGNRLFIAVQRWYPLKERIGAERFLYRKELGDVYNTRAIFVKPESEEQKNSKNAQKKKGDSKRIRKDPDEKIVKVDENDLDFIEYETF